MNHNGNIKDPQHTYIPTVHVLWNQPNLSILVIKSEGTNESRSASRIPRGSSWATWWPRICEERKSSKRCEEGWDSNQTAASENQFAQSEPYRGAFMSPNPLLTGITYPSFNPNLNHKQSYPSNKTLVVCGPSQLPPPPSPVKCILRCLPSSKRKNTQICLNWDYPKLGIKVTPLPKDRL